jgi:hypothetical protein
MLKKMSLKEGQRNVGDPVEVEEVLDPTYLPCFLCGAQLEVRASKRKKPYCICDPCGLQAFVRKERGIQLLAEITSPVLETENGVLKTIAQLERVNKKLKDIEGDKPLFSINPELELADRALRIEKQRLLRLLKETPNKPDKSKNSAKSK